MRCNVSNDAGDSTTDRRLVQVRVLSRSVRVMQCEEARWFDGLANRPEVYFAAWPRGRHAFAGMPGVTPMARRTPTSRVCSNCDYYQS